MPTRLTLEDLTLARVSARRVRSQDDPHAGRRDQKLRKRREFQADNRRSVQRLERLMKNRTRRKSR